MAIIISGKAAHKINHSTGLRPFGLAIIAPAIPAITIRIMYLPIVFTV